jgi:subfamily B ATP-binding cassette protein MsbA
MMVSLGLVGVSTLLGLLWAYPLAILIDIQTGKKMDQWLYRWFYDMTPQESGLQQVFFLTGLAFLVRIGSEILKAAQSVLNIRVGLAGVMRVRCDVFRKLQQMSLAYHRSQPQGDAMYRVTSDTYGFESVLNVLTGVIINVLTLVFMVVLAAGMNLKLTLVALAVIPIMLLIIRQYGRVLMRHSREVRERDSLLQTTLQRAMQSIGLVQAFNREHDEYARFDATVQNSLRAYYRLHWHEVMYWFCLGTVFAIGATAIFGYGTYLIQHGALTIGSLAIFLDYIARLYDPLNKLSSSGSSLMTSLASVDRVFEVLDRDPIIKDVPNAIHLPRLPRRLELDHVSFGYDPAAPILRDLCVTIEPGQMVAFVGSSGVGKTTLLNLFPRFYDPTAGSIKLDGIDIRNIQLKSLRGHIALVLQENMVLPTTIQENIAYGFPNARRNSIRRAAALAGAATFIERMPHRYYTQVMENGSNLSGGQRQRLGIARALLSRAPIIVLDEPTSALDPENEMHITSLLRSLKGGRTIIMVSHRLSTVADCDRIFVMDNGRIVETGSHDQLIAQGGIYRRLARHQLKMA